MTTAIAVTGQILIHDALDLSNPALAPLVKFLRADVTFANLEATITTSGSWPTKTKTLHLAEAGALASIKALGFNALAHANNHAFDLGPPGIEATHAAASMHGIGVTGSGKNIEEALTPAIIDASERQVALFSVDLGPQPDIVYASADRAGLAGLRMHRTVGVPRSEFETLRHIITQLGDERRESARAAVGYRPRRDDGVEVFGTHVVMADTISSNWQPDEGDLKALRTAMQHQKSQGRLIGIALHNHHWDANWTTTPDWMINLGRQLIDAGACFILGTGAPVMQPVVMHHGFPIVAGLGNFVFHTRRPQTYNEQAVDVWRSAALRLTFDGHGACSNIEVMPIAVSRRSDTGALHPAPLPLLQQASDIINRLALP
ncbi:CapA family protein [Rhizobium sp.]|jgi:poly-gamma-glutamate capsule biosynthesis protein CapA/YwtB (metallophosphatase superfamily)|uniref:CapA family protein n=1 Tax=Rhizobium sp. TaxID=391 RepID=UPI000E98ACED|nr:hypothetical protein [Rhizobium sp.]